jgi:hypothetical protein
MSQKRKKHSMSADVKPEEAGTVFLKCAKELEDASPSTALSKWWSRIALTAKWRSGRS